MILGLAVATAAIPNFVERKNLGNANPVGRKATAALDTNAKRLAVGLPPLPARRLWSRTDAAKRGNTSPLPSVPYKGKASIIATNGTFIGFVSKVLSSYGTYVADSHEANAALISFTASSSGKSPGLLLKDETSVIPSAPYLGAVVQHGFTLAPRHGWKRAGTQPAALVVGTGGSAPETPPHSITSTFNATGGPVAGPTQTNNNYDGESGIWTYDAQSKQWTAIWTNPDSSSVPTAEYYNPDTPPGIALVSDVTAYTAANPHAFPITLNFSP